MPSQRWNYVDVTCLICNKEGKIRIDQFNRRGKTWECRSCAYSGKKLNIQKPSPRHDPIKQGAWNSYYKAKQRCNTGHGGYYTCIEFRFNSFEEFYEELGPRPDGMSLDRINNLGHYEPGNVRWATHQEQCNNRRARGSVFA